jgi:hypothetical protein
MSMALLVRPDRPTRCSTEPSEGTVRPDSLNRDFRLAVAFCASFPGFPYRRDAQYKNQYSSILGLICPECQYLAGRILGKKFLDTQNPPEYQQEIFKIEINLDFWAKRRTPGFKWPSFRALAKGTSPLARQGRGLAAFGSRTNFRKRKPARAPFAVPPEFLASRNANSCPLLPPPSPVDRVHTRA